MLLALVFAFGGVPARAGGNEWLPVEPADLSAAAPVVEKTADAEAIFWDVRVQDEVNVNTARTVLQHYVRVKIFTERGKEKHGQVEIPYLGRTKITEIAGRTIHKDGSTVELKNDAVFDRTVVKKGDVKVNVKSFAMPAVEPGCLIEYRWKEIRNDAIASYIRLQLQREIPVQRVTYHLKPLSLSGFDYGMRTITFNGKAPQFTKEPGGFYATTMTNVPAFDEEPYMPAEEQVRPWVLVYYAEDHKMQPAQYWNSYGKRVNDVLKSSAKANDRVKAAAAEIVAGAATPDEKLQRIYDFCRTQIKNLSDDASGLTPEDYKKLKDNKQPSDTLERKAGFDADVAMLFAALATSSGFETRLAHVGNHDNARFDPAFVDPYFLDYYMIAVKVGSDWRFVDPSETYLPYGMLYWAGSGQAALVADPSSSPFVETPTATRDKSVEKRTATLKLSEDGTLEGDVRVEYTGHLARARKEYDDDDTPAEREKTLKDAVTSRLSTAELSNIKVLNVTDANAPFVYEYHVRVPGYAQRTGKRLFVQPAFFQANAAPRFPSAERKHRVQFQYGWTEQDEVNIELPAGYALDHADSPEGFGMGAAGAYAVKIFAGPDGKSIRYQRTFGFGGPGLLLFETEMYPKIKLIFDTVRERDGHMLTVKQGAAS
jgi:hypothetical protein